ncbi:hypothetical protein SS50377_21313 [Spironucleus salmonicida]|uniref:Uncharacterized protein n=1 Tax=Spironucleus salmonicida TaxID=348837 RepID=A0A9P8LWB3_9EUKA|nr:hypothetical protein SS50377_21313 [Spironucleus salmonicida]
MTDQDQNTKAEAKPTQLTFSSLDKDLLELQQDVVFSFIGIQFKISEVDDTVRYLKITIDTVNLSLLHLFMWQHRQGLLLRSDIQLIIIQDDLKDPSVSVSDYWLTWSHYLSKWDFQFYHIKQQAMKKYKNQQRYKQKHEIRSRDCYSFQKFSNDSKLFPIVL